MVDTLPVGDLLGTDRSELPQLLGKRASYAWVVSQEDVIVELTSARKKREVQNEILLKEKEVMSGVVQKPVNLAVTRTDAYVMPRIDVSLLLP